jgi:protein LTV1
MGKQQFINRQDSSHFQLVHRSQRDPLISDSAASSLVLKPILPSKNLVRRGHTIPSSSIFPQSTSFDTLDTPEDPTHHGIFFDDGEEYDYFQHLKPIDDSRVLASEKEEDVGMLNRGDGVPRTMESILELDPDVRQVMEALEEEAFLVPMDEGEFFDVGVLDGDALPEGYVAEGEVVEEEDDEEEESWVKEFQRFKQAEKEGSVKTAKSASKRAGTIAGTDFSMTSSVMYRNKQLSLLDDRFDRLLEDEYASDDDCSSYEDSDEEVCLPENGELEEMFDSFLDTVDIRGRKMRDRQTPTAQIDEIRGGLRDTAFDPIDEESVIMEREEKVRDGWDCETILSTYSNIYNHPRFIKERSKREILMVGKDGIPLGAMAAFREMKREKKMERQEVVLEEEVEDVVVENRGEKRDKKESAEEKKARKSTIKQERKVWVVW